jgi:hypothetical protein
VKNLALDDKAVQLLLDLCGGWELWRVGLRSKWTLLPVGQPAKLRSKNPVPAELVDQLANEEMVEVFENFRRGRLSDKGRQYALQNLRNESK